MNAATQYDLSTLLERAGAQPPRYGRGKWRCPKHGGSASLSVDLARGLFNCHHGGCHFRGSADTLARALGLVRRLSPAECCEQREARERADREARALYECVKTRRFELLDRLHSLNRLELQAHDGGPDEAATWDALATVHAERPGLLAELALLENAGAADLIRLLSPSSTARESAIASVILDGGLADSRRKFLDFAL